MERLKIERIGGFAGFGAPGSALKSQGQMDASDLSSAERSAVESLFAGQGDGDAPMPDGFRYRITRQTESGSRTIEVAESRVPVKLRNSVRDRLD